ncbi:MAG: B12-binding domain-containing radical SAM protein [Candidatus Velthaea sp.]
MARNVLCVFPHYSPSFGTFEHAYPIAGVAGFMPPQGLLAIAAAVPPDWTVRFIDENIRRARGADFRGADVVFASGMHIQRQQIDGITRRAHAAGRVVVLGGPSVSAAPETYPGVDILHIGELGDATADLFAHLDGDVTRPARQMRFETRERTPLDAFPTPAYHLIDIDRYLLGSVQATSGCPYRCEFCDIPELYGQNPRLKSPGQIVRELDAMLARGNPGAIYFVDDNFVGNRKFAKELLPHLVAWQKERGYPVEFACEATLNIAKSPDLLALMRDAYFTTVFCGIETPEPETLHAIAKDHNRAIPLLEAVDTLNSYGLEVVSGIIIGFDTDSAATPGRIIEFIERSKIPLLTINLLQALPRTPLWRRLESEGRLYAGDDRETNVEYALPYEEVLDMWRRTISAAYDPEALYRRFAHFADYTFAHRITPPNSGARVNPKNIRRGITILTKILIRIGIFSHYRRTFWKTCGPLLRQGRIEPLIHIGIVGHHLITYARNALAGKYNASHYSAKTRKRAA